MVTSNKNIQKRVSKWVFPLPNSCNLDQDGERFDEEIIGTRYSEHWYNPNGLGTVHIAL